MLLSLEDPGHILTFAVGFRPCFMPVMSIFTAFKDEMNRSLLFAGSPRKLRIVLWNRFSSLTGIVVLSPVLYRMWTHFTVCFPNNPRLYLSSCTVWFLLFVFPVSHSCAHLNLTCACLSQIEKCTLLLLLIILALKCSSIRAIIVITLDSKKASDSPPRERVLLKTKYYGVADLL